MTRAVITSTGGLYYWRQLAASHMAAETPEGQRAACLRQMAVNRTAPFSWDHPIEGGATEFTWPCPECGEFNSGRLSADATAPGTWANTGSVLEPTLVPLLACRLCRARWGLANGVFTRVRRLPREQPRRGGPPGRVPGRRAA
jgi:hypothetical protein